MCFFTTITQPHDTMLVPFSEASMRGKIGKTGFYKIYNVSEAEVAEAADAAWWWLQQLYGNLVCLKYMVEALLSVHN